MAIPALADPIRLATLQDAALLSDPPEGSFGHLPELAAKMLQAPISLITFVDANREFVESFIGLPDPWASHREIPLDHSYCKHLIPSGEPLLIEDARKHELTRNSPAIQDLEAIAYAGIPLCTKDRQVLGGFCVIDRRPREWTPDEVEVLAELAHTIERQIDQRLALRKEERERAEMAGKFEEDLAAASRFRTLVENSLAGIYLLQGEQIVYTNPRLREIFGYAAEDFSGLRVADLVVEEDRARVMENIRRRMEGEERSLRYVFRGRKKNGSAIDVEVLGSRTEINGQPAVIGTLLDVSEQKRTEAALRESAERLRLVERATEDVIWEWNVHTGEVRWNEAGPKMFRYEPQEVGRSIEWHHRHIHPEDREEVVRDLQGVLSGVGEYWSAEYRFRRGDGQYATVLDRGIVQRDPRGEPACVVGVMMDVTERRREEEAQRFLSRASALMDSTLDQEVIVTSLARHCVPAIGDYCTIDLADETRAVRRVAATHVDPTKEEQLLPGEATERRRIPDQSPVTKVIRTGEAVFLPEWDDADLGTLGFSPRVREAIRGSERASLIIAPLRVGDRTLGAIVLGTCMSGRQYTPVDLTLVEELAHRTALATDHARLYREATEAVRAREEILGIVSHDLRNPLNAIQMSTAMLQDLSHERRAANQKWLDIIVRTTDQMGSLIDGLLDLSSIEAGRFSIEPAPQDVPALLDNAGDLLGSMASEQGIRFRSQISNDLSTIQVDSRQILRVISNLVGNAIKFTPEGGEVALRVERSGDEAVFTVSDTGPGITEEHLSHIFEPYWQARPGERRGAGLGLAIAKGIVEAHGGRIWAESEEGKGSAFFFAVPAEPGPRAGGSESTRTV